MFLYSRNTWYRNVYTGIFVYVYTFLNRYKLDISVSSNILIFMFRHTYCVVALHMYVHVQLFGKSFTPCSQCNVMYSVNQSSSYHCGNRFGGHRYHGNVRSHDDNITVHGKISQVSLQLAINLFWWVILQHVIFCWYFVESQSLFNIICLIFDLWTVSISLK